MEASDIQNEPKLENSNSLYVKPFYWSYSDKIDAKNEPYFSLVAFGHEYNTGQTIALHIRYEPWIDIVLPDGLQDSEAVDLQAKIMTGLRKILYSSKHGPTRAEISKRLPLYYYTEHERHCLKMHFKTEEALNHCKNLLKKPLTLYGCEPIDLLIAGANNKQVERLHAELNIRPCDWIRFTGSLVKSKDSKISYLDDDDDNAPIKVTTCRQEYNVDWRQIERLDADIQQNLGSTFPSFLVFDHEMYSARKYAFPDELNSLDCIFNTGFLYFTFNFKTQQYDVVEYALVYHKTIKFEQIEPIPYTDLVQINDGSDGKEIKYEIRPKVIGNTDANIDTNSKDDLDYDFISKKYWEKNRVRLLWCDDEMSLIDDVERIIRELDPDGIIGHNSNSFDFKYHKVRKGRMGEKYTNMSRNQNWNQSFDHIEWESSAYNEINLWVPDGDGRIYFDTMLMTKRDYKEDSYGLDALCQKFMGIGKHDWHPEDIFASFRESDPEKLTKTIKYCMQDVWCTWGLFQHLGFWSSYSGMSNIMGIGIFDLFSRGQQIRTLTQMFKECHKEGYFLHAPERTSRSIAGGYVFPQLSGLYEYVLLLDFEGLYPSIMRRYNISNDTFDLYKNAKDEDCFIFKWTDEHGEWDTRFVKPHIRKGLVPSILEKLYIARNEAKAKMAECKAKGDKRGAMVYNVEQLANKLSGNSIYGGISQKNGKLSLSEAGAAVTAYGRMSIKKAGDWVNKRGYDVIYGDSVTGRTPILLRIDGQFKIFTIEQLFDSINDNSFTTDIDALAPTSDAKEYRITIDKNIEAWTSNGWTKVKNIMRHKTTKQIYRVITKTGYVEVTEDHSLLRENGQKFTPKEAKIGDKLLQSYPEVSKLPIKGMKQKTTFYNQLEATMFYYTLKKTFKDNVSIKFKSFDNGVNTITNESNLIETFTVYYDPYHTNFGHDNEIIDIVPLSQHNINGLQLSNHKQNGQFTAYFVYDLTTENHHFQAGVGNIIVHNTDSIFIKKRGELTLEEKLNFWKDGQKLADEMNAECFQAPIRMQVDGAFRTLHSISKKMYQMIKLDLKKPLEINPNLWSSKGLVTAKRDSCKMIRNLYKEAAVMISCMKGFGEVIQIVGAELQRLLTGKLDIEEMISIRKLGKGYSNKNLELPVYQRHLHENGMNVKPGDRLPFVYALRPYKIKNLGDKWEDPEIFMRGNMEYDRMQYLESQFQNKLDTLLYTAFPDIIPPDFIARLPKMIQKRPEAKEDIMLLFVAIIETHMNQPKVAAPIETIESPDDNDNDNDE